MKKKFESNVATQVPKTQMTHEPQLPWEIRGEDLLGDEFERGPSRDEAIRKAPLGIKPAFLIFLLIFIFVSMLSVFLFAVSTSKSISGKAQEMEDERTMLFGNLRAAAHDLKIQKEKNVQLEKNRDDLRVQNKELMTVIKTLSHQNVEVNKEEIKGASVESEASAPGEKD